MDPKHGRPTNLIGEATSHGFWVHHTSSQFWFRCFLHGEGSRAQLRCKIAKPADEPDGKCGRRRCDFDRATFKTNCVSEPGTFFDSKKCIYTGHFGELRPLDMTGKPTPYQVFVMSAPEPCIVGPIDCLWRSSDRRR